MKDILNKALAANADTDAVAKVIDTVVNTPRQDGQLDIAVERRLAAEEAYAKTRKAVAGIINSAVCKHISILDAADNIIRVVNKANKEAIEDYIWSAKSVHKLDYDADSAANANANHIVNVDAAGKGKDKSDRRVFRKDANGRIFELRGVNNDAPDELY